MNKLKPEIENICPRCGKAFHCSKSDKCWCFDLDIPENIRVLIQSKWDRCLCPFCLCEMIEKSQNNNLAD